MLQGRVSPIASVPTRCRCQNHPLGGGGNRRTASIRYIHRIIIVQLAPIESVRRQSEVAAEERQGIPRAHDRNLRWRGLRPAGRSRRHVYFLAEPESPRTHL